MKRIIMLVISLLAIVSAANAQLRKGDLIVGGNIGLILRVSATCLQTTGV